MKGLRIAMNNQSFINISGTSEDIARWIWKTQVPKSGQSKSIQGEVLRAIEKLRWEAQNNGNINWDYRFEMLVDFIEATLTSQSCFSEQTKKSIRQDLGRLRNFLPPNELKDDSQRTELPYIEDGLYNRLTEHLIVFCKHSPRLIPLEVDQIQCR